MILEHLYRLFHKRNQERDIKSSLEKEVEFYRRLSEQAKTHNPHRMKPIQEMIPNTSEDPDYIES